MDPFLKQAVETTTLLPRAKHMATVLFFSPEVKALHSIPGSTPAISSLGSVLKKKHTSMLGMRLE